VADTLGATLRERDEAGRGRASVEPALILALECGRPMAASVRYRLSGVAAVNIGRGKERTSDLSASATPELTVRVPDRWMSTKHARIEHAVGRWVLIDTDSKNGSIVDGHSTRRTPLADGALIELGHTMFVFRERYAMPAGRDVPVVLDLGEVEPAPSSQTLDAALGERLAQLRAMAESSLHLLLTGEPGTGKLGLARLVHTWSRCSGPALVVRGGALPASPGDLLAQAAGGTLIIEELEAMPATAQAALLRALESRTPAARVVALCAVDVDAAIAAGELRRDLVVRLAGFRLDLPPIVRRRDDLGLLIGAVLARGGAGGQGLEADAARLLFRYPWPLGLRELEQALTAALVLAGNGPIRAEHLPESVRTGRPPGAPKPVVLSDADAQIRDELMANLRQHAGNVSAIARAMNKDRKQIQRWLKRFSLDTGNFR
jgi:hypothetical protein